MTSAPRLVTLGESMGQLRGESVGSLVHLPALALSLAGAESNVAIAITRLGHEAAWIGRVGDDAVGERVVREIRAECVATHVVVDPSRPTGLVINDRPSALRTRVAYYRAGSAASAFTPSDIPDGLIERAEVLHLTGITPALSASAAGTVVAAAERARAAGVRVSFDVNHRSRLWSTEAAASWIAPFLPLVDILFGGEDELRMLAPEHSGDIASLLTVLRGRGPVEVVAKLGPGGAMSDADGVLSTIAGHRVPVVDTVGAGDVFVAGHLAGLLSGEDAAARLAQANACGALQCTVAGDWQGAPRPADLALLDADFDPVSR